MLRIEELSSRNHDLNCFVKNLNINVLNRARLASGSFVLGIGGYSGLGKTTIALRLAQLMGNASVLTTDSFMFDRNERKKKKIGTSVSRDCNCPIPFGDRSDTH